MNIDDALSHEREEKVKDIIQTGTDIAGATMGAAIGLLVGGPGGCSRGRCWTCSCEDTAWTGGRVP